MDDISRGSTMKKTEMTGGDLSCNPDVVLREEDEDGGLLFNPDTNEIKVINTTGLFIWKQCARGSNPDTILSALRREFSDIPEESVHQDIKEYLELMVAAGFLGWIGKP
jgi:hypothetical protein